MDQSAWRVLRPINDQVQRESMVMCNFGYHTYFLIKNKLQNSSRSGGQVSNCCVADYLSILCTKFYRNQSEFVETTEK